MDVISILLTKLAEGINNSARHKDSAVINNFGHFFI